MRNSERIALTGLIVLGVTALATGRYVAESLEQRVQERAEKRIESLDIDSVLVRADGINLALSGRVATNVERDKILAALEAQTRDGKIIDNLMIVEPLVDLRPASLRIQRDPQSITISGEAPNAEASDLLVAQFDRAGLSSSLLNLMKAQDRRASNNWLIAAEAAVDAITMLQVGAATVERGQVRIEGVAVNAQRRRATLTLLEQRLRNGFALKASISSPPAFLSPYAFVVRKSNNVLTLQACAAPNKAQQAIIATALSARNAPLENADACPIANGSPNNNWASAVNKALASLDRVTEGEVQIVSDTVKVVAFAPDDAAIVAVRSKIALGWPTGYTVNLDIRKMAPIIDPFNMTIVKRPGETRLAGFTPSVARAEIWADALDATNQLKLARGAPKEWLEAVDVIVSVVNDQKIAVAELSDVSLRLAALGEPAELARLRGRLQARLPGRYRVAVIEARAPDAAFSAGDTATLRSGEVKSVSSDNSKYVFVARKKTSGVAAVTGLVGDDVSRSAIETYARAKLGGDALQMKIERHKIFPPVGWQRAIFAALDALAHLDIGEVIVEEGAFYLRGSVNRAFDAQRSVFAAKSKTPPAFAHFSWITVSEDALALAQAEEAKIRLPPEECVARANAVSTTAPELFFRGEAKLSAASDPVFDRLAILLNRCAQAVIIIEGHTDAEGTAETNLTLSRQRAFAVRVALIARGVEADRLQSVGYGAERPIADNATEQGRKTNQRIEFSLSG